MSFSIDLSTRHQVVAANSHYYKVPTHEKYIDRTLPYHDLVYILEGNWNIQENNQEYPIAKDDVLLLFAGRHHFTRRPCSPGTRSYCIHISCEPGDLIGGEKCISLPTHLNVRTNPKIKSYFNEIISTYWIDAPYKKEKLSALLDLLFINLKSVDSIAKNNKVDIATKAIEIITETPHHRFQTQEIADMFYVSTRTLDNAMRNKVGMPFYSYQLNMRLEMVASQLEMEPDLKLQEIAVAYGFHDEFHMSKAFKKKYNMSPLNYRKMKIQQSTLSLTNNH